MAILIGILIGFIIDDLISYFYNKGKMSAWHRQIIMALVLLMVVAIGINTLNTKPSNVDKGTKIEHIVK